MAGARFTVIVDVWDPRRGGLEAYAAVLTEGLVARGFDLAILTGRVAAGVTPPAPTTVTADRGPRFYAAVDRAAAAGRLGVPLSFRHPGAVGGVFLPLGGLFADALDARRAAEPAWLRAPRRLARLASPKTRCYLARERAFFRTATADDLVLAPSRRVAASIARRFPALRAAVIATGLPVDPERFAPPTPAARAAARASLGVGDDRPLVLWIGHDAVRKGLAAARAAVRDLAADHPGCTLAVAGRVTAPRDPRIVALGARDDVPALLHAADLLLLPTLEDSFGLVIAEALATGLPVVTTRCAGAAELVTAAVHGAVVDHPRDVAALAAACRAALAIGLDPTARAARRAAVAGLFVERHVDSVAARLSDAAPPWSAR